jgi:hypothetical protein
LVCSKVAWLTPDAPGQRGGLVVTSGLNTPDEPPALLALGGSELLKPRLLLSFSFPLAFLSFSSLDSDVLLLLLLLSAFFFARFFFFFLSFRAALGISLAEWEESLP